MGDESMVAAMQRADEEREKEPKTLAEALSMAQGEMLMPDLDSVNPHFKSKYASLPHIKKAYRAALAKYGLAVSHHPGGYELVDIKGFDRKKGEEFTQTMCFVSVTTSIWFRDGSHIDTTCQVPAQQVNAHGIGGAITYAKRYNVSALLDLPADEDDDGNAAVAPQDDAQRPKAKVVAPEKPREELAGYVENIQDFKKDMLQAQSMEALRDIWGNALHVVRTGIKSGHLDQAQLDDLEAYKDKQKQRISDPHNVGSVEEDVS